MRPIPQEKVDQILSLKKQGYSTKDIAIETGVNYNTARGIIWKKIGGAKQFTKDEIEYLRQRMAEDRMEMCIGDVADKYGRTIRYISSATKDHPDRHLFKRKKINKKQKNPEVKVKKEIRPKKPLIPNNTKKEHLKKEPKLFRSDGMQKGHVKLKKEEKVIPTRKYTPSEQRAVPLNDGKNTLIFVNINDTRTNDEVRRAFIEKNEREYQSLKSSKIDQSKKRKKEVQTSS